MQSWGLTDVGCTRAQNQDAFLMEQLDKHTLLCVVCDGMGGAKSGNIASTLAADVFVQQIKQSWSGEYIQGNVDKMMKDAIKVTNFTVFDQSQQFEEFTGMGTTLVAVLTNGKWATIVNVGDSRAYLIDRAGIHQVTVDHSVVQLMVSRGELTPEQAKTYPGKSLITRAIGTETLVHCDIFHKKVTKGDYLLLCSDGLSNLMDDQEILFEVAHGQDKEKCCQRLLDIAKKRGAPDNVTSILLSI
ncbi:MAG: Stp1/IreP family PP2C-type Ser/Thr phosphatase [Oscillospiraceae bacterium]|jgi:protein phosphatase|nr:Stp1/IreP family PP2C-type Ser/Thr phosphatase [Oscillospiraceae bacterium]